MATRTHAPLSEASMSQPPTGIDDDSLAAEYAQHRRVHPGVLQGLLRDGSVGNASRVLEVGCGTGNYVVALASRANCECWAIDPSEQMLARARERSEAIHWRIGRAERLAFPDATFDVVFSVDVIHHVGDRAAYFREAHRVLRPGGRVCTVTDSEEIIRNRRPMAVYFPETVAVDLARVPPLDEVRRLMSEAGFRGLSDETVELAYDLTDSQAYRDRAYSMLHLIPNAAFHRGLARLEADLRTGPVPCVARYSLVWGTV
jgi:ubiquinone/menaquinone biosynthesis C-methylase UbiE